MVKSDKSGFKGIYAIKPFSPFKEEWSSETVELDIIHY